MSRSFHGWSRLLVLILGLSTFVIARRLPAKEHHERRSLSPVKVQLAKASWYGKSFKGRRTAGGSIFNPKYLTAAHRTLRLGTRVRVTEPRSGRSVVVRITDRGPYCRGRDIDLSYAAARALGIVGRGVARVRVEPVVVERTHTPPPIVTAANWPKAPWLPNAIVE